ncbi:MAG: hypothetical protein HYX66_09265 [Ignavibacteria bacterium]|nr:hypothetical protein [Ignavibacteria bacterium]
MRTVIISAQFNGQPDLRDPAPPTHKIYVSAQAGYSFEALVRTYEADITSTGFEWYGGAIDFAYL